MSDAHDDSPDTEPEFEIIRVGEVSVSVHPDRAPIVKELLRLQISVFDARYEDEHNGLIALHLADAGDAETLFEIVFRNSPEGSDYGLEDWLVTGVPLLDEDDGASLTYIVWLPAQHEADIVRILSELEAVRRDEVDDMLKAAMRPGPPNGALN